MRLADKTGIRVLLSNPSFEVWLLCHVATASEMKRSFHTPDAADQDLKKRGGFNKQELHSHPDRFISLVANAEQAVAVAKEVHLKFHGARDDIRDANACTTVYQLVEYILGYRSTPP